MTSSTLSIEKPTFSPVFQVEVEEDKVLLLSNGEYTVLEGTLCATLAPFLTGNRHVEQIVQELSQRFPAAEVYLTLMLMADEGYIIDATSKESTSAFWQSLGYQPFQITNPSSKPGVKVVALGGKQADTFLPYLEGMHLDVQDTAERTVVLTPNYLDTDIEILNQQALQTNHPFFLVRPYGPTFWIGPAIHPGASGCWVCLKHRLELNQPSRIFMEEQGRRQISLNPVLVPNTVKQLGYNLAALETAKWLVAVDQEPFGNTLVSFDLRTLETKRHTFVRRPQCPVCGDLKASTPYSLNATKTTRETNYRVLAAKDTVRALEHHVSPITGVVRSLSRIGDPSPSLVHNYTAGHSVRRQGHSIESLRLGTRDHSGGKGKNDSQAKASGLCEALERYSAVYDDDLDTVSSSFDDFKEKAIHPKNLLLYSQAQYEERENWNARQSGYFQLVPEQFDESAPLKWTKVWSLFHNLPRYVPASYCYFGFDGTGTQFCKADSNGLASGNCLEEAIFQGALELAERDAVGIWWYNRTAHPGVDLDSFEDPYFTAVRKHYQQMGRGLWVLDLSNDLNIPTFVAVSPRLTSETEDILLGFGAHVDARLAITRAILEVNQSLPAALKTKAEREKQLLPDFADVLNWWNEATTEKHTYLAPSNELPMKNASNYEEFESIDLKEKITWFAAHMNQLGMDTLVLNLTRPDIGLSVAKVIVPGLRHFWRRLAPGRLFEVPVKMKLIKKAHVEHLLNPVSLFL